jgi:hypothetical protein
MPVGHDATSIFLYRHHPVKGSRKERVGRMIASEFDDRSSAQAETGPMITRFKLKPVASVVLAASPPALFRAAIPNR